MRPLASLKKGAFLYEPVQALPARAEGLVADTKVSRQASLAFVTAFLYTVLQCLQQGKNYAP